MGIDKLEHGNKDYTEGYAAGFAAGVAAWFAAIGNVNQRRADSGSNVVQPAENVTKTEKADNNLAGTPKEADPSPLLGKPTLDTQKDAIRSGVQAEHPDTDAAENFYPPHPESHSMNIGKHYGERSHSTEDINHTDAGKDALAPSMEIDNLNMESACIANLPDEELNLSYTGNNALASPADTVKHSDPTEHPETITEEDLGHIAPGCFVRVGSGDASYWVEIGKIEGITISGMVHPELSGSLCLIDHDSCEIARFRRDQITALGCDRYCWC